MTTAHISSHLSQCRTLGRLSWFGLVTITLFCTFAKASSRATYNRFQTEYFAKTKSDQSLQPSQHHASTPHETDLSKGTIILGTKMTRTSHRNHALDPIPIVYSSHHHVRSHSLKRAEGVKVQEINLTSASSLGDADNSSHGPSIPKHRGREIQQDANMSQAWSETESGLSRHVLAQSSSHPRMGGLRNDLQDNIWQKVSGLKWGVGKHKGLNTVRKSGKQYLSKKTNLSRRKLLTDNKLKYIMNQSINVNKKLMTHKRTRYNSIVIKFKQRVKRQVSDTNKTFETTSLFSNDSSKTESDPFSNLNKTANSSSNGFEPSTTSRDDSISTDKPLVEVGVSETFVLLTNEDENRNVSKNNEKGSNEKQRAESNKEVTYNNTVLLQYTSNSSDANNKTRESTSSDNQTMINSTPGPDLTSSQGSSFTDTRLSITSSTTTVPETVSSSAKTSTTIAPKTVYSKSPIVSKLIKITEPESVNSTLDIATSSNTSAPSVVTVSPSIQPNTESLRKDNSTMSLPLPLSDATFTGVLNGSLGNDSMQDGEQIGEVKADPEPDPEPERESDGKLKGENELKVELDGEADEKTIGEPDREPDGESNIELDGEPNGEPNGEPGGEPNGEPNGEPESEDSDSPFPLPEPGPQWDEAKQKWGIAWDAHVFGLGGAFGVVGVYTFLSLIRLWRIPRLLSKGYFFSLNFLMMALCGTRAGYLLYDSYNSGETFPISVDYFLYSIAFPCLSAAFSVLLYALLKATNMQLVSPSVQRLPVLLFIIVAHFGLSLASDLLVGRFAGARIVLFVCQVYYILWGLFLFAGYAYIFRKLYSHAMKRQKNVIYASTSSSTFPGGSNGSLTSSKVRNRYTLSTAVKVTFFTALCGLVTVGLELYAVAGVYNTFTWDRPKPWPWYMYHTVLRVLELVMCVTMSYVASQPFRYRRSESGCCNCCLFCVPCGEILCCSRRYSVTDPKQHVTSAGSCSYSDLDLSPTKLHSTRLRTPGDRDQLQGYSSPTGGRKRPVISAPGPPQASLLVVEDGFVRFQTDKDIKRRVDSPMIGGRAKVGHDFHNANTLPLRDGYFNTGYPRQADEKRLSDGVFDQTDNVIGFPWEDDKSRKSSLAGGEFFRPLSSVSLADSIENELEKAFVTFRMDVSKESPPPADMERTASEEDILDITAVSELPNMKETDLISVDSLPQLDSEAQQDPSTSFSPPPPSIPTNSIELNHTPASLRPESSSLHLTHTSPRRPFTLLRRAKSSEVDSTSSIHQDWSQMLKRSLSDHVTRRPPLKSESSSVRYSHLLDMDSTDSKLSEPGQPGLDDVFTTRRPAENWTSNTQDAFTKSLLNSSVASDNIDV